MADGIIQVPPDSTGKKVDAASLDVGANSVIRQRIVIADNSATAQFATVTGGALVVTGTVNVSAIAAVSGLIGLTAGASNIGFINHISQTVQVAIGTPFTVNNISATVNVGLSFVVENSTNSQVKVGDSANAAIRVNVVAGSANGVSQTDGTTFSTQAANFVPVGGIFDDSSTDTLSENDAGVVRMTTNRAFHTNLRTDGGIKMDDSSNAALRVTIVSGAGSGGTAATDRSVFTESTTSLTPAGGVCSDTRSAVAEDAVAALRITTQAGLHVNLRSADGNEISAGNALSVKVERVSATASVVLAAGTAAIGAVSLGAGTANIGFINGISATVTCQGNLNISNTPSVILAAGTANFGTLNNISRTVEVTVSTPFTINNISATVTVTTANPWLVAIPSASHGPKMVQLSTSATATLIAAPGGGLSVYVTMLGVTNGGTVDTGFHCGASVSTSTVTMYLTSAGGGFVMNFDPPWKLPGNEALLGFVDPNSSGNCYINLNFFVAA